MTIAAPGDGEQTRVIQDTPNDSDGEIVRSLKLPLCCKNAFMATSARGRTTELKPLTNNGFSITTEYPLPAITDEGAAQVSETVASATVNIPATTDEPVTEAESRPHLQQPLLSPVTPSHAEETVPESTPELNHPGAQKYPWLYMAKTLEACFNTTQEASKEDILMSQNPLAGYEPNSSSQQPYAPSEVTAAGSNEELSIDSFAETAPKLMQAFLLHGDICDRVETEALQLATYGDPEPDEDAPLQAYMDILESLDELLQEAIRLESSILNLTTQQFGTGSVDTCEDEEASARQKVLGVFAGCLPVLRARISNLKVAQELTDGAQENLSITLRMESLGL